MGTIASMVSLIDFSRTTLTDMSKVLCEAIFYTDIIWEKIEGV
jgi:hypothetical protein